MLRSWIGGLEGEKPKENGQFLGYTNPEVEPTSASVVDGSPPSSIFVVIHAAHGMKKFKPHTVLGGMLYGDKEMSNMVDGHYQIKHSKIVGGSIVKIQILT
jgi:hypothetical protein